MKFKLAKKSDAPLVHHLMIQAFMEYKDANPPSSALEETVESITASLIDQENALIAYVDEKPVGMVRFKMIENELYFYRLSVIPEVQGKGIAKKIVKALEEYAKTQNISALSCKVRKDVARNVQLYRSLNFLICDEEVVYRRNGINFNVVTMRKQI